MDFKSMEELKQRVMPALRKKANDFKIQSVNYNEEDIWNHLRFNKWMKSKDLSLNEIVNDILKITKDDLD